MEELQSTEALDREILEDARKKAHKILKTADENAAASKTAWDRKLAKTLEDARKSYARREEQGRREIMARLPMDRRRIRSEKIEGFLGRAMNDFFASLDRRTLLSFLEEELASRFAACDAAALAASCALRYRGLEPSEVENIVKQTLGRAPDSQKNDPLYTIAGSFPALTLDFPGFRVTASIDRAAGEILREKRAELAAALLGEAVLEETDAAGGAANA
jgi:hypothetical protein